MRAWDEADCSVGDEGTHFGFVFSGTVDVHHNGRTWTLEKGMYFSVSGSATICPVKSDQPSRGIILTRYQCKGFFQIGGPVEEKGRLRYIDGCTDSLLLSPLLLGDPCLNLLHIPPQTEQTQHTHPSLRFGIILSGRGTCVTPSQNFPLQAGTIFHIPANDLHSFHTNSEALRVIAWHPDSDCGPTHEDHPMINKTIVPEPS